MLGLTQKLPMTDLVVLEYGKRCSERNTCDEDLNRKAAMILQTECDLRAQAAARIHEKSIMQMVLDLIQCMYSPLITAVTHRMRVSTATETVPVVVDLFDDDILLDILP